MQKSGERIPKQFFFTLSGKGNFTYLKSNSDDLKRRVAWGDGRVKQIYKEISDIVGFQYRHIEGKSFEYALQAARKQIDSGCPVILGCLDMYYLHYYPKFYHKVHIPIHYIMMIGYDDGKQLAYVLDCGIEAVQSIPYETLAEAMNVEIKGLSKKNTICTIAFQQELKSTIDIAKEGFHRKAIKMLESPVGFAGIRGMYKFAKEFPHWQEYLTKEDYTKALENIVMYSGSVPKMPNRLLGIKEPDDIRYMCGREQISAVLAKLGQDYQINAWCEAAALFLESGAILERMIDQMTGYLLKEVSDLREIPELIKAVAQIEEKVYGKILSGL